MRHDIRVVHDRVGSYVDWVSDNPSYAECLLSLEFHNYTLGKSPPNYPVPAVRHLFLLVHPVVLYMEANDLLAYVG